MKNLLKSCLAPLGLFLTLLLISCGESSNSDYDEQTNGAFATADSTATYETDGTEKTTPLAVYDSEGTPRTLYLNSNTSAFAIATWCPYSKEFIDMLNDEKLVSILSGQELVFLVEQDEWSTMLRKLDEDESMNEAEKSVIKEKIQQKLKSHSPGKAHLIDLTLLNEIPGEVYYFNNNSQMQLSGFPSAYSGIGRDFTVNRVEWILNKTGWTQDEYIAFNAPYSINNDKDLAAE